ncbi:hypothetical protein LTS18_004532 [Coniosporium uncinatum]|uniref:Uncharacterized protein n=1 Tax=Coniosporium uncinatum TaxID=93489 RepID=A0ACC3D604_9PEZI|nr:hypothetical protein LTS18_004532 [Coniosporium uncinatum]
MRFQARFMTQSCINTYVSLTRYYNDLNAEQLKRAHRFFYRVAFKMELGILLYRVDILRLFQTIIKGPEPMDKDLAAYKEWEELTKQIFKKIIKKVQERPELVVEMLFSKINATTYYLERGYDREVVTRAPRPPAELEVKPGMESDAQIGVAVGVLIDQNKSDALAWVKGVLISAAEERQSWQDADAARKAALEAEFEGMDESERPEQGEQPKAPSITVKPENDERRVQLFKDNKVRLLLTLLGCERLGLDEDADASWIIPSSVSAESLKESLELIGKFEFDPPTYENGKSAEDFLRSKAAAHRRRAEFDNSDDDAGEISDSRLFPVGGPTERKSDALKELKSRRKRNRHEPIELDDAEKDRRADARRKADLEKRKKIKSDLFVHDSDDESDDERDKEFFAQEEERRKNAASGILRAMTAAKFNEGKEEKPSEKRKAASAPKSKKKRKTVESEPEDEEDTALSSDREIRNAPHTGSRSSSVAQKRTFELSSDDESEGAEQTDTPLSSQQRDTAAVSPPPASKPAITEPVLDADMEGIDDEPVRKAPPVRRNMRAGFLLDSDSDD